MSEPPVVPDFRSGEDFAALMAGLDDAAQLDALLARLRGRLAR